MTLCEPILRIYESAMIMLVLGLTGQFVAIVALIIRYSRVKESVLASRKELTRLSGRLQEAGIDAFEDTGYEVELSETEDAPLF